MSLFIAYVSALFSMLFLLSRWRQRIRLRMPILAPCTRLEKSRAQRILWLLEELKIDYELKTFKRKKMLAPPELKEVHPLGKSPVITVSSNATNGKPIAVAESSNIIEYLIDHFGTWLAPRRYKDGQEGMVGGETEEWMRYRYFLHYAEGSLMPLLVIALLLRGESFHSPCIYITWGA